ncbi:response regulator transcription factor [Chryseobacterium fistulae]|nr:response regulator transcription factor [Chryseobacterium fistulae]
MKKKVLIADAQYVAVEGLIFILKSIGQDMLVHRVYNEEEIVDKLIEVEYDLLILDVGMLAGNFESKIKELKKVSPPLKIMIFTRCEDDNYFYYLHQGVDSIIYKSDDESEIRESVYSIFKRGYYYRQEFLHDFIHITKGNQQAFSNLFDLLSEREKEVYDFLIKGIGILEISNVLNLHQSTVSTYKRRLFKKLNINSLPDLIKSLFKFYSITFL